MKNQTWTIAELSEEFDVTARTIRFYEAEGMIAPERRGTQRLFYQRDRVRLKLILRGKRLGFSLAEIREIIDLYDAEPGETGQLQYLLDKVKERRADLEQRLLDIAETLTELADVESQTQERLSQLKKSGSRGADV